MTSRFVRLWLRIELRRRWRSLLTLALLVTVCSAAVLGTVAGARRGASAPDRLQQRTLPATALARANVLCFDWDRVRELPDVAAVSTYPGYSGFGVDEAPGQTVAQYLPLDDDAMRTLERPVVLAGRLANPARDDEAVVTENFVHDFGLGVGDVVTVRLFSPEQVDTGVSAVRTITIPRPGGTAVRTRIVGVVRSPWFSDRVAEPGRLIPSPGLFAAHPRDVLGAPLDGEKWALVRLKDGDAGLEGFRRDLDRLTAPLRSAKGAAPDSSSDVIALSRTTDHLRDVARFEAACLLGLAAAMLLASAFLLGPAVARHVGTGVDDLARLTPLGATPRQAVLAAAGGPALSGLAGTLGGAVLAAIGSRWLPFGVAATLEPQVGVRVDVPVLTVGGLLVAAGVAAWAATSAMLDLARRRTRRPAASSMLARAVRQGGLPVTVVVGTRFALERGPGGRTPVRAGLIGCAIGVLGVLAGTTFAAGVRDAVSTPQRFGQSYQLVVALGYDGHTLIKPESAVFAALRGDRDVAGITDLRFQVSRPAAEHDDTAGTDRTITVFGSGETAGDILVSGRRAQAPDQVVLAPGTARRLGLRVGSVLALDGSGGSARLRVSGIGFVPQTEYNEYDSGAWVTDAGYLRLFPQGFLNRELLVALRSGADPVAVAHRFGRATSSLRGSQFVFVDHPLPIARQVEIRDLRVLPLVLGIFLAVLAVGATGHVLATSARRRRHEVAVLRALGMTRWQAGSVSMTQAAVHAAVGLAFGVPLGVALGRVLWQAVAASTPLAYRAPSDLVVLLLALPVTLLAVQLLALPAARRAIRLRVADILRAE